MNKEELLKEFNDKVEGVKQELLAKLEKEEVKEKKPFEIKIPYDLEDYYVIDECGDIYSTEEYPDGETYKIAYLSGATFKTKKQAKRYDKERRLLFKLHQWAKEKNGDWEPDWSDIYQGKYHIFYDYYRKELNFSFNNSTSTINKLPYFKTERIAKECIELFGEEIKEVLC